jgi:hypothetical protein
MAKRVRLTVWCDGVVKQQKKTKIPLQKEEQQQQQTR